MYLSITYFYECLFCNLCEITIKLYDIDLKKLLFVLKITKYIYNNYIRKHIQLIFYIVFMQAYYHVSARHVAMAAGKEY